ncbi:hypothetical protein [Oricola indica]|uniref:hypothetical protein n=1 Tax=Oricola indica TaxID=2872591 RepID=UPI003CCB85A4
MNTDDKSDPIAEENREARHEKSDDNGKGAADRKKHSRDSSGPIVEENHENGEE